MDPTRILASDLPFAATLARRHDAGRARAPGSGSCPRSPPTSRPSPCLRRAQLHGIDCPALVVCGDHDPFVPPEHAAGLARQLPGGQLFVAPDCGHEVMARRPGLFNEALGGFYRSTEAAARLRAARAERGGGHVRPRISPCHRRRPRMTTLLVLYRAPEGGADALADAGTPLSRRAPAARRRDAGAARRPGLAGRRGARRRDRSRARRGAGLRRPRGARRGPALRPDAGRRPHPARDRPGPGHVPRRSRRRPTCTGSRMPG